MSQIEPYGYPPDDDDDFEPMQMRGGSSWQPGWRPPSQQPGCGPSWPGPGLGGGGWPFWGYWGFRLRSAWRDVKFLNKLLGDIVNEQIDNGIIAPGPNFVPGPGSTVPGQTTGIKGVTDGSDAGPGMVGEFITQQQIVNFAVGASTQVVSLSVVPAGDWDLRVVAIPAVAYGSLSFSLSPQPAGLSNSMRGQSGSGTEYDIVIGQMARASVSVPTLMAFTTTADMTTAGSFTFVMEGRRMR